ncbi:MAG: PolC-type DNA polymerase III [Halofilum sp. (in: g-proteobacteria)]
MSADRPIDELAHRARAIYNRLLHKGALADRRVLHDRCVALDTRGLLATPIADARFVVLDLETTGLAAYAGDEIVQVAMIEYRGLEPTGEEFCSLVRPSIPIPARSTAIHGIDDEMVADAPAIDDLIDPIIDFLDNTTIVGHHIAFDLRFLNRVLQRELFCRLPHPTVDTMLLYLSHSGRLGHHELVEVAGSCRVPVTDRHDARGDALTTGRIFAHLARPAADAGRTVRELIAGARAGAPDEPGTPPA